MTTRANVASRRNRNAKSLSVHQTQDCDSESEMAVTSTSSQKVVTPPAASSGRQKRASASPGMSKSGGTSRSPRTSKSPSASKSESVSPVVVKPPGTSKSFQVSCSLKAPKSPSTPKSPVTPKSLVTQKSPVTPKSLLTPKSPSTSKSPVAPKSPAASESCEATDLRIASKVLGVGKQPAPSKRRRCLETVVKEEQVVEETADDVQNSSTDDQPLGCQRLLMREWLLHEVEQNRTPGLGWLDKERRLIRIPWIHASKDGWSKDSHCKLFENWAIYTGKYDGNRQKSDHKRWKANFRCALNSLGDIKEEPSMSKKNGMDGYRVYRVEDAIDRKGHRKHKTLNSAPTESRTHSSVGQPSPHYGSEIISNQEEHDHPLKPSRTSPATPIPSKSPGYMQDFTDSMGKPILLQLQPSGVRIIACSTEYIRDTVCPGNGGYTSLSNMVVVNDDGLEFAAAMGNQETMSFETVSNDRTYCASQQDIVSLRNLDHNYFKVQIPTTVENFVDDEGTTTTSSAEQHPKTQRKNAVR